MKKRWIFPIILILILLALWRLELQSLVASIRQLPLWSVVLLFGLQTVTQGLLNLQWHQIARVTQTDISFFKMLYINCQGSVIESITPGVKVGGEVTRAIQISRLGKCSQEQAATIVALQKLFSLSLFFFWIFLMPYRLKAYLQTKENLRCAWSRKIRSFLLVLLEQVILVRENRKKWLLQLLLAALIWLLYPVKMYLLAIQVIPDVSFIHITVITFAAYGVAMLPIFPGGLGGFEGSMSGLLVMIGFVSSSAVALTVVFRFTTFWFVMLFSLLVVTAYKAQSLLLMRIKVMKEVDYYG